MARPKKAAAGLFNKYGPRGAFLLMDALTVQLKEDSEYIDAAREQGREDLVEIYMDRLKIGNEILAECNRAVMP